MSPASLGGGGHSTPAFALNARLKESGSTYSIGKQPLPVDASAGISSSLHHHTTTSNTLERGVHKLNMGSSPSSTGIYASASANSDRSIIGAQQRSVLFAADVSASTHSIKDALLSKQQHQQSTASPGGVGSSSLSTANAIKQTLSPLAQHRQTMLLNGAAAESKLASGVSAAAAAASASLGTYQFPSSTLKSTAGLNHQNHHENYNNHPNHQQQQQHASPASLRKTMSPSRSIVGTGSGNSSSTNLPTTNVARNMLYQSESSYSLKSGGNGGGNTSSIGSTHTIPSTHNTHNNYSLSNHHGATASNHHQHQTTATTASTSSSTSASAYGGLTNGGAMLGSNNPMNIYGTLPKSVIGGGGGLSGGAYASGSSMLAGNDFEMMSAAGGLNGGGGGGRTMATTSNGGYNTLGSYRVQYSSTNPFLPSFNPTSNGAADGNSDE